jgi:hypothetical protein
MYKEMELEENEDDNAVDMAGYTGIFRRESTKNLKIMEMDEFIKVFKQDNKLAALMKLIQDIDSGNGYITTTEIDDILKIIYP